MWTFKDALATWVGAISRGGLLWSDREEKGVLAAASVVGESRLEELTQWLAKRSPEDLRKERIATIELCIWLATADREIAEEERELITDIVGHSDLPHDDRDRLLASIKPDTKLDENDIAKQLSNPVLQELLLAMAWQVARADGKVEQAEQSGFDKLVSAFGLSGEVAARIKKAVEEGNAD